MHLYAHTWLRLSAHIIINNLCTIDCCLCLRGSNQRKIGRKLPFNVSFPDGQQRNDSDGAGIVPCGKRPSVSLVFRCLKSSSSSWKPLFSGAWVQRLMTDHFMPPPVWGWIYPSVLIWLIEFLFVSCHSPFFRAAYQLAMATNNAPLTAAGLMSVGTAHCRPINTNLMLLKGESGWLKKWWP